MIFMLTIITLFSLWYKVKEQLNNPDDYGTTDRDSDYQVAKTFHQLMYLANLHFDGPC